MNKVEELISMTKLNDLLNKKQEEEKRSSKNRMDFCDCRHYRCSCGGDLRNLPFLYPGLLRRL